MGGDTLGMEVAGCKVVAFNEFDKHAIANHKLNFPDAELIENKLNRKEKDRTNIQLIQNDVFEKYKNQVDLIFAGFCCQGFSNAGKKLPNDPRNSLFKEFIRSVEIIEPKYIIGENMDGLLKRKTGDGKSILMLLSR